MRVLYVDDEEGLLEIGKLFLEKEGEFSVDTVLSASAALEMLKNKSFDAIISDYMMPEMDGIAFLKEVRSRFDNIPFILFTGRGREEIVIEALNEGADFYLQKGGLPTAQFAELAHKIKKSIIQQRAERELSVANNEIKVWLEEEKLFSDFSQFLLNATSVDEVLDYFGNLIFARSGADYLMLGKLFTGENAIGIHSLRGFGPLLGQIGKLTKVTPESLKVPVDVIIAHKNEIPLEPGLRKLDGGISAISRGYLSKPVCTAIEKLLQVKTIYVYELVWEGNLYGSITFGFRQGHEIQNPSLINTLGNLLSNGLWRIYSTDAISSERKSLAESEGKFRTIFENSPYPISINSVPEGTFIAVNAAFLQSSGYTEPEVMGKNPVELGLLTAVDFGRLTTHMLVKGRLDNVPMTLVGKGRKRVHVQYSTIPVSINDKPAIMTVTAEITRLKRVEEELLEKNEELRESEARVNSIIQVAPVGIGVVSDRIIQTVNDRLCQMTGYAAEELTGKSARILYPTQEDFDNVGRKKYAQIERYGSGSIETRWQKKDGTIIDVLLSSTPFNPSDLSAWVMFTALDITESRQTEKLVRESENKFATVFRSNPVTLTLVSAEDGRFVDVNDAFVVNTGYSREEVIGRTAGEVGIFADAGEYDLLVSRLRSGQPVKGMEVHIRQKNGESHACQFTSGIILMQGRPHILSSVEDIADRRNAELAFRAMTMGMVGTTGRGSLDRITESIRSWLGADCIMVGEIQRDRKRVNVLSMLLDGKKVEDYSYTLQGTPCDNTAEKGFCLFPDNVASLFPRSRDLHELNIRGYAGTPLWSAGGSVIGILCILTRKPLILPPEGRNILDIIAVKAAAEIERKQAEDRLTRINEALLHLGTDHQKNIDSLIRLCGEMLDADCVLYNRLDGGLLCVIGQWSCPPDLPARDKPGGHICFDVITGDRAGPLVVCDLPSSPYAASDPNVAAYGLKTYIGHPVRFGGVTRGSLCAVYTRDILPTVEDREIIGILSSAVAQEEERREADQALRESEERYRSAIENIHAAVVVHNPDTSIRMINTTALALLGLTLDEAIGRVARHPAWHFSLEDGSVLPLAEYPVNQVIAHQKPLRDMLIGVFRPKSQDRIWVLVNADPEFDENGMITAVLVTFTEITGRKQAEEALRQANRKLNLLSGITRHDIKNQLLILNGFLEISKKHTGDAVKMSEFIAREEKIAKTMERQISFTREYEAIGVNAPVWQVFCNLVETAATQAPLGNVHVKNDVPAGFEVFADPLVVKVCYNLMDNAVRYGGKITTIRFAAEERGDNRVVVCEDDGAGIPAEEKEQVFERGFGKNTGMGLFLSAEILSITGITIRETGEPGKGARFEITVPKGAWRIIADRG